VILSNKYNLRTKLRILILVIAALTFVNAWYVFNYTNATYKNLNYLRNNLFPSSNLITTIHGSFLKQIDIYQNSVLYDDKSKLKDTQKHVNIIQNNIKKLIIKSDRYREFKKQIIALKLLHKKYSDNAISLYSQYINQQYNEELQLKVQKNGLMQREIHIQIENIHATLNSLIDLYLESEARTAKSTSISSIAVSIALILFSAYIIYYFTVTVFKRLYILEHTSNQLNLSLKYPVPPLGTDELGILSQSLENMRVNLNDRTQELTMQKNTAESALKTKSEFLANMSHEIRTPMNTILGMIDNLSETTVTETQKEYIASCKFTGRNLLVIINDILNLSKIEAGQFVLNENNFSLKTVVKELKNNFSRIVSEKKLNLIVETSPDIPEWLYGGDVEFWQILVNIIGNAIKFTNEGGVVKVRFTKLNGITNQNNIDLKITVEDTGIGMTPELVDNIFQVFKQGDASYSKKFAGTGLGMSITKKLLELMKGTIEIESQVDKGSVFTLNISMAIGEEEAKVDIEGFHSQATFFNFNKITHPNILIVEDNEDNQHLIRIYLSKAKFNYAFANDGMEAIALFKKGNFNIVFMDIQMPVVNGYEATKTLRKFEKEDNRDRTAIIALSAYIQQEDIEKSFNAGCDAYLTKPVSKKNLFDVIQRLC